MEVTLDRTAPCEATVHVTVPWNEFESELQSTLRRRGRNVRMKGFRPGKVPLKVLEKQFGEEARNETVNHFLSQAYRMAVEEHDLSPIGHERISLEKLELEPGNDIETSFSISLKPKIELGDVKGMPVESQLAPVLDEEVDAAIEDLRRQRSRPERLEGDEGLPEDGMALVQMSWLVGEEVVFERDGLRFSPAQPPQGFDPEAFRQALSGAKEGDAPEITITLPPDFEREELRGQEAVCRFVIAEAYRLVPPSDEELCQLLEADSMDRVREIARERIGEAKAERENRRIEAELLERLIDQHADMQLPEKMVESQLAGRKHQLEHELGETGADEETIASEIESQLPELRRTVERGLRAFFIVDAIAQAEGLKVRDEDLVAELQAIARRNQTPFEEVRDYYAENRLFDQMAIELLERKVRAFLREHADVKEPS